MPGQANSEGAGKKKRGRPSVASSPDGHITRFLPSGVRKPEDPLIGVSQASNGLWIARIDMDGGLLVMEQQVGLKEVLQV